ncbi:MAG: dicarboxylate/amino acid:cation symporter [Planctomycetota bacterium]
MKFKLHNLIFVGMALGIITGLSLYYVNDFADKTMVRFDVAFDSATPAEGTLTLAVGHNYLDLTPHEKGDGLPLTLSAGSTPRSIETKLAPNTMRSLQPFVGKIPLDNKQVKVLFVHNDEAQRPLAARSFQVSVLAGPNESVLGVTEGVLWWLDLFGPTIFMGALKMIIAPLILASIVAGVTSLPDMKQLGAIGWKTMVYYISTTTIAVVIGLVAVLTIQPGKKAGALRVRDKQVAFQNEIRAEYEQQSGKTALKENGRPRRGYVEMLSQAKGAESAQGEEAQRFAKLSGAKDRTAGDILKEDLIQPILMNPFEALTTRNSLGIIFFALLLGVACTVVGGPRAGAVVAFFQGLNAVIMQVTTWLMAISPFAITCIMAKLVAENGPDIFETLSWYCGTVIGGILVHVVVLLLICKYIGGIGPLALWRGLREAWMIAFTTRSSAATLPVTIENVTQNLNVSPKVANFSLPLGATMNMDGTALYEGIAVIFLIQMFGGLDDVGITMTAMTTLLIFITAVMASVGAAAVPDAGLVTMVLVATAVHLPIYYIPLIFAVDAFLDMFRTSTNVLGDSIGAIVVNRLERGKLGDAPVPA